MRGSVAPAYKRRRFNTSKFVQSVLVLSLCISHSTINMNLAKFFLSSLVAVLISATAVAAQAGKINPDTPDEGF